MPNSLRHLVWVPLHAWKLLATLIHWYLKNVWNTGGEVRICASYIYYHLLSPVQSISMQDQQMPNNVKICQASLLPSQDLTSLGTCDTSFQPIWEHSRCFWSYEKHRCNGKLDVYPCSTRTHTGSMATVSSAFEWCNAERTSQDFSRVARTRALKFERECPHKEPRKTDKIWQALQIHICSTLLYQRIAKWD